jgi:hypothetical protein
MDNKIVATAFASLPQPPPAALAAIKRELLANSSIPLFTEPPAAADILSALYFVHTGAIKQPAQVVVPMLPIVKRIPFAQRALAAKLCSALSALVTSETTSMAALEAWSHVFLQPPKRKWGSAKEKQRMRHSRLGLVLMMIQVPELVFFEGTHGEFVATFGDSRTAGVKTTMERWHPRVGEDGEATREVEEEEKIAERRRHSVVPRLTHGEYGEGKHRAEIVGALKDHAVIATLSHGEFGEGKHRAKVASVLKEHASAEGRRLNVMTKGHFGEGKHRAKVAGVLKEHAAAEGRRLSMMTKGHFGEGKHRAKVAGVLKTLGGVPNHFRAHSPLKDGGEKKVTGDDAAEDVLAATKASPEGVSTSAAAPVTTVAVETESTAEPPRLEAPRRRSSHAGQGQAPPLPRHLLSVHEEEEKEEEEEEVKDGSPVMAAELGEEERQRQRMHFLELRCDALEKELRAAHAETDELRTQLYDSHFLLGNFASSHEGSHTMSTRHEIEPEIAKDVFLV